MAATETQKRLIQLIITAKGEQDLKKIASRMEKVGKASVKTSKALDNAKRLFAGFVAGATLRGITRAADTFGLLQDRIAVFAQKGEDSKKILNDLAQVARNTGASVEGIGTSFNRLVIATSELGLSTKETLKLTQGLQQTFRLSGSTIAEATAATIQLSQGLGSGALRGQELRSVLEANGIFVKLLSDELGIARGNIIKFAESGKITSDVVINTIFKSFDDLNKKAGELSFTFEQGFTFALDAVKLKINELNREFGISNKFVEFVLFTIENSDKFAEALIVMASGVTAFIATLKIASIAASVSSAGGLGAALLLLLNPVTALAIAIGATVAAMVYFRKEIGTFVTGAIIKAKVLFAEFQEEVALLGIKIANFLPDSFATVFRKAFVDLFKDAKKSIKEYNTEYDIFLDSQRKGVADLRMLDEKRLGSSGADKTRKKLEASGDAVEKYSEKLKSLNLAYKNGKVNIDQYNDALRNLQLEEANNKFEKGSLALEDYNKKIKSINEEFEKSNITKGATDYVNGIGTLSEGIVSAISNSFSSLEDELVSFVTKGKFSFKDLANSILEDMARIVIQQQITGPLARGLGAAFSGGGQLDGSVGALRASERYAMGGVFSGGSEITAFANGGVVGSPTMFPMANGTGLMGEKGPEAIIPLSRNANGKLGVEASGLGSNVTVNVINNAGAEVETSNEQGPNGEQILNVKIEGAVKGMIGSGKLDRQFNETYGLRRRGR